MALETTRAPGQGARRRAARRAPLDAIFRPRSVAVIGASRRKQTIGREILHNLVDFEFTGPVYPVNPEADAIHSMKCYRRVEDVPGPVDLAVVVVPRERGARGGRTQCGKKGVRGLVVITAGFKEVGAEGARARGASSGTSCAKHGMRMVGPNCMGVINTEPDVRLNATFAGDPRRSAGTSGFVSQSGALGEAILADATENGLGVAMFASMGNKTDVSGNDLLEYWEDNPDVAGDPHVPRVVREPAPLHADRAPRHAQEADHRGQGRPHGGGRARGLVAHRLDRGAGRRDRVAARAVRRAARLLDGGDVRAGARRSRTSRCRRASRVAIVTNAGGPGILCTDACVGARPDDARSCGPRRARAALAGRCRPRPRPRTRST